MNLGKPLAVVGVVVVATGLVGCGASAGTQALVVFAAASLRPTFTEIGHRFETDNPGVAVEFDFASAADLATQLTQGASTDVFASADTAQMDKVAAAGLLADGPVDFASNTLVIVTAPGNPKHLTSFADLAKPGLAVVISPPPMPCGVATRRIEDITGVDLNPVSEEPDVEDVLNKVVTGQADAGLVNITDTITAGDKVDTVSFPEAAQAVNVYPIAMLQRSGRPELARRFLDLVTGEPGQKILAQAGFTRP